VQRATREFVDRVFAGSASGLLSHLLKNERIPANELEALRALIDEHARNAPKRRKRSGP
jgi:predicted transcriptional regulator